MKITYLWESLKHLSQHLPARGDLKQLGKTGAGDVGSKLNGQYRSVDPWGLPQSLTSETGV